MLDESFFVEPSPQEKEVVLSDGKKHKLFFRAASAVDWRKFVYAQNSTDEERQAANVAHLIAKCVCNPDGTPAMTFEQAARLKPEPANAIFNVIVAMSKPGDAGGNDSRPEATTGSGTSSLSDSAAEQ